MYRYDTLLCLILTQLPHRQPFQITEIIVISRGIPLTDSYLQAGLMLDFEEAGKQAEVSETEV
jgi:hypothetical protein